VNDQPGAPAVTARPTSPLKTAAIVALVALTAAMLGPVGTRVHLWGIGAGTAIFFAAPWIALVAALLALVAVARTGRLWRALGVIVVAMLVAALPVRTWLAGRGAAPIHDVTTDLEHPPEYVAIAKLRTTGTNPAAYAGEAMARQQRLAYADLRPLVVLVPPERALALVADTARAQGWTILVQDIGFGSFGRLEATETSALFGRVDDIVVRVVPHEVGSRIDVRSSSRDDAVDAGRNAQRIRRFLAFLAERARAEIPRNG
jgi:uncharacterized protein (DUF1499 family)